MAAAAVEPTNLFDWAELKYPQFFPTHVENQVWGPYVYRYYPKTLTYLAVTNGVSVQVLGPEFGPDILTVGTISQFVCDVFPENCLPPIANPGSSRQVTVPSVVTLDASASTDPNGEQLTYAWSMTSKPPGSSASLANANSLRSSFTADIAGAYVASLVVNNGFLSSAPQTVTITAKLANVAPVANAGGSLSVAAGTGVYLNGGSSYDQNGDPITYQWSLTTPAGSFAALANATTSTPYFTPDIAGTYVATLVVNDGQVNSVPSSVSITATSVSSYCCKHCTTGKPCGDTCISTAYICHTVGGCACY